MTTFADLGIEFPLFAAEVDDASDWSPEGECVLCNERRAGFTLGVGHDVIVTCGSCGSDTAVPADGHEQACVSCGQPSSLDGALEGRHACWLCLRSGRWTSTMDTEAGMIRWDDARRGRTHGLPFPAEPTVWAIGGEGAEEKPDAQVPVLAGFETTEPNSDGWRGVIIPTEVMLELTMTPSYITWQGEGWLFHCRRPMQYIGRWGRSQFNVAAEDGDGRSLAIAVADLNPDAWDMGLADEPSNNSSVTVYMFRCIECGIHRGHWDMD